MRQMSAKSVGASAIVDAQHQVIGIFTDGDLRRLIEKGVDLRNLLAQDVMHYAPRTVKAGELAVATAELMEQHGITSVLVTDADGKLCGIVHIGDLMRAKVI
jgi:arabinose-5-phosphate isomerase